MDPPSQQSTGRTPPPSERRSGRDRRGGGKPATEISATHVATWIKEADESRLKTLVAANVDAKKLLLAAYVSLDASADEDVKDLASEVDDILRRVHGEGG